MWKTKQIWKKRESSLKNFTPVYIIESFLNNLHLKKLEISKKESANKQQDKYKNQLFESEK